MQFVQRPIEEMLKISDAICEVKTHATTFCST